MRTPHPRNTAATATPPRTSPRARRVLAAVAGTVLVLTACSDGDAEPPVDQDQPASDETDASPSPDPDEEPDSEPATGAPAPDPGPPRVPLPDVDEVTITTIGEGVGTWPTLAWEPVDGAERYRVTVYADGDGAYWAWTGSATEVVLGGFATAPSAGSSVAPRLDEPMSYDVVALDDDGAIIAQSGEAPIAP